MPSSMPGRGAAKAMKKSVVEIHTRTTRQLYRVIDWLGLKCFLNGHFEGPSVTGYKYGRMHGISFHIERKPQSTEK